MSFGVGIGVGFDIRRFLETLPTKEKATTIYVSCPMPPEGFHGAYVDGALRGEKEKKNWGWEGI